MCDCHLIQNVAASNHCVSFCPQARLISLYFDTKLYQEALQLGEAVCVKEKKKTPFQVDLSKAALEDCRVCTVNCTVIII